MSRQFEKVTLIKLWDSQWVNIVNADYSGMSKQEAIDAAVKAAEAQMAKNYMADNWPTVQEEKA